MMLTPAQQTTLKTDMHSPANSAALGGFLVGEDWPAIAAWYNAPSGLTIWRPSVPVLELTRNIVGSVYDAIIPGKQNGFTAMTQGGFVDATSASIRAWFQDIFGPGATLNALTAEAQKSGSRFELLFSSTAAPSNVTTVFGQALTPDDCQQAELHG
jgi:hypothetical protein